MNTATTNPDLAHAAEVDAYVNRRTASGSPEQAIVGLVRYAVRVGIDALVDATEAETIEAETLVKAASIASGLRASQIRAAIRVEADRTA